MSGIFMLPTNEWDLHFGETYICSNIKDHWEEMRY